MSCGLTPNFSRIAAASRIVLRRPSICTTRVPRTHCARSLSGVQMATFSTFLSFDAICAAEASASSASNSIIGQDDNTHRRERLLERMELREQRGLDAGAGLVVRPKPIAKRLDHVIGRDAEVRVNEAA